MRKGTVLFERVVSTGAYAAFRAALDGSVGGLGRDEMGKGRVRAGMFHQSYGKVP